MASLINCQPVTSYTAEEFAGDMTTGTNLLEIQTPPTGFISTNDGGVVGNTSIKYLVIKPLPGYTIDRSMVSISTLTPLIDGNSPNGQTNQHPNGRDQYWFMDEASGLSDMDLILVYDSLGTNWESCDNNVIIQCHLKVDFVMPDSNYTINIDLGGTAVSCNPLPPPEPDVTADYSTVPNVLYMTNGIYVTNYSNTNNFNYFFAQYYDEESYASSEYNIGNHNLYLQGELPINPMTPPVYDFNNIWQQEYDNYYNDGSLNSFQPTYYTYYTNTWEEDGMYNTGDNTINTTCGQLYLRNNPAFPQLTDWSASVAPEHPNNNDNYFYNPPDVFRNHSEYKYAFSNNNYFFSGLRYLPVEDYPTIDAGGPALPTALTWYISVGDNPNYNLIAGTEFVDVWKIMTISDPDVANGSEFAQDGNAPLPPSIQCNLSLYESNTGVNPNLEYYISDGSENNSDLDINNISITQVINSDGSVNNKAIKLRIPFKSGLSISRFGPIANVTTAFRRTKVFINIYPTEI